LTSILTHGLLPFVSVLLALLIAVPAASADEPGAILPLRERAEVIDRLLGERLDRIAPELMREHGFDMWIIAGREYNEDPVLRTMLPATWLNARRRTVLVLFDPGEGAELERLAVSRYSVGEHFEAAWEPDTQPDQWARLVEIIETRDLQKIGINVSSLYAHADGMTHTEHESLEAALPEHLRDRLTPAEDLAIGWLETRLPEEMDLYASICRIAHEIMAEALSERVIQPGVTTTDDVKWWARERIASLGLSTWFHPLVSVQRSESTTDLLAMISGGPRVIRRGDLIHMDLGITYLRLNTDTQQMAYVLRRDETGPPEGLRRAFARGNEMQDILTSAFAEGRTGNEILRASLDEAASRGIDAMVYTHPLGFHGHAAGPAIGMWDKQGGVPGVGDRAVRDMTCYAIELSITERIPEWDNQEVRIMMEEDAVFENGEVRYIDGRQTELHIVR